MKLEYFGHSCFRLSYAGGEVLVTDPFDPSVTLPPCTGGCTAALISHDHFDHNYTGALSGSFETLRTPGVHTHGHLRVTGLSSFHDEVRGAKRGKNIIYIVEGEGLRLAHLGDLGHLPDAALTEELRGLDLLLTPIGGNYTIDSAQAAELIALLRPRAAVAMHFRTPAYDIAIADERDFIHRTHAARLPREIEITPESLNTLPPVSVMNWQ